MSSANSGQTSRSTCFTANPSGCVRRDRRVGRGGFLRGFGQLVGSDGHTVSRRSVLQTFYFVIRGRQRRIGGFTTFLGGRPDQTGVDFLSAFSIFAAHAQMAEEETHPTRRARRNATSHHPQVPIREGTCDTPARHNPRCKDVWTTDEWNQFRNRRQIGTTNSFSHFVKVGCGMRWTC
jgi:hypothetical protein